MDFSGRQAKATDEVETATAVARRLQDSGFDAYIALQEQSLRRIKENIFERLENSEYFIFVDFKRERLKGTSVYRGSLFSHQELALASYLDIPILAFQESGVKQDDGILRFLQGNAVQFTDRHLLPNVIADQIRQRNWDSGWRNELVLERPEPAQRGEAIVKVEGSLRTAAFFHVGVRNRHRRKMARNCYVYLENAIRLESESAIPLRAAELKWEGYVLPNAHIPPGTVRNFDGFYIFQDCPQILRFQVFSDSTAFIPRIEGAGAYKLTYAVVADNFPTARCSFLLRLAHALHSTTLEPSVDPPRPA